MWRGCFRHVMQSVKNKEGKYFALKTPRGIVSLFTGSIYYVEVYDHELLYHTEMGDFKTYGRLLDIQQKLQGYSFIQCNRSYLVNMRHVQSMNNDHLIVTGPGFRSPSPATNPSRNSSLTTWASVSEASQSSPVNAR